MDQLTFYRRGNALEFVPTRNERAQVMFVKWANSLTNTIPTEGEQKFDWKNAVVMAIEPRELIGLALGCEMIRTRFVEDGKNTVNIFHDHQGVKKRVELSGTSDSRNYRAFLKVVSGKTSISVGLSETDLYFLEKLLPHAAAAIMGWTTSDAPSWHRNDYVRADEVAPKVTHVGNGQMTTGEVALAKVRDIWQSAMEQVGVGTPPSKVSMQVMRSKILEALSGQPNSVQMAKAVLKKCFDVNGSSEMDQAMVETVLSWIIKRANENGTDWVLYPNAPSEIVAIAEMG